MTIFNAKQEGRNCTVCYFSIFDEQNIDRKILEHIMGIVQVSTMIDFSFGVLSHNTGAEPITDGQNMRIISVEVTVV